MQATVRADETSVFPRFLDLAYPNIERGKGVWLETSDGQRILDASSGGADLFFMICHRTAKQAARGKRSGGGQLHDQCAVHPHRNRHANRHSDG